MKTQEPREAIGYGRVSTTDQADDGSSLDMQQEKIRQHCEVAELKWMGWYEDRGVSGKNFDERPKALAAIDDAIQNKRVLIVYSLSRLSRSLKDTFEVAGKLQDGGAELVSLKEKFDTTSPTGRMIFGILAVLNQFEREITRERTIDTLKRKKQKGERVGRYAQYGYKIDAMGDTVVEEEEQAIVRTIRIGISRGASPNELAALLNRENVFYRNGKPWKTRYIERILNS